MNEQDVAKLTDKIVEACRILDNERIMDDFGHFSARIPNTDHILINGKVSPGRATIEDIVRVDLDGNQIGGVIEAAAETPLHVSIYNKRPDVAAVAHTHSEMVIVLGSVGIGLRPIQPTSALVFVEQLPIYEGFGLIDTKTLGDEVAEALAQYPSVMLRDHGNVVVGGSVEECCLSAIWMERAARIQCWALAIGEPVFIPKASAESTRKQALAGKSFERSWDYYAWRAKIKSGLSLEGPSAESSS